MHNRPGNSQDSLWDYAVACYNHGEVGNLCLQLQDEFDQDVPLLLFLCWHGQRLGQIDQALMARCVDLSRQWQDHLVAPLRQSRRWLKTRTGDTGAVDAETLEQLRTAIKASELDSERLQLKQLESLALRNQNNRQSSTNPEWAIATNLQLLSAAAENTATASALSDKLLELAAAASRYAQSDCES